MGKTVISKINLLVVSLTMTICSCSNSSSFFDFSLPSDDYYTPVIHNHNVVVDNTPWNLLLEKLGKKGADIIPNINISLTDYESICKITDNNLQDVKNALIESLTLIPCYDNNNTIFRVLTNVNDIADATESSNANYNLNRRNDYIKDEIKPGMNLLKLRWNYNDTIAYTYCVVSDKSGIVYDDFITNTVIFESSTTNKTNKRQKTRGEDPHFTGSWTWTLTQNAYWLWGSERGMAQITHICYYNDGRIIGQDSDAYAYMTIGNSEAERTEIEYNKIAYGYGLSTPLVDITLTYESGAYSLSFSTSLGSKVGDTGTHTHFHFK